MVDPIEEWALEPLGHSDIILRGISVPVIRSYFCCLCSGHEISVSALLHGLCIYQLPYYRLKSNESLDHGVTQNKPYFFISLFIGGICNSKEQHTIILQ